MTSATLDLSVVVPTHNPDAGRLRRTLAGLQSQTLPIEKWETILVDNASSPELAAADLRQSAPPNVRVVSESRLGLSSARRRGFQESRGGIAVLVDDDNVLAPEYLATVLALFAQQPRVGAMGGRSVPDFESKPENWLREFDSLLALRDLGDSALVSSGLRPPGAVRNVYPSFAPIGAGLALRREAWTAWANPPSNPTIGITDRRGGELTSGGDNDIVLSAMKAGWEVGYFPSLLLTHLIPNGRVDPHYLARLNRGIQKSWMQVLTLHDANPWPSLSSSGAALRKLKAWFTYRAWQSSVRQIRWQGACGHFEGRVRSQP